MYRIVTASRQYMKVLTLLRRKNVPRVISLNAHPISTKIVYFYDFSGYTSLIRTNVKLLSGPIAKLANTYP